MGLFGESGGSWVTMGVGLLLAERNEGHLVRFMLPMAPQTGNTYITERVCILAKNCAVEDRYLFPNLMGDELAKKAPYTIVYTSEFDYFKQNGDQTADLMSRNGRLLDYGIIPGLFHEAFGFFELKGVDMWYRDIAKVINKYMD